MTRKQIAKLSDRQVRRLLQMVLAENWRRTQKKLFLPRKFPLFAGDTSPKPYDVEELRLAGV
jgi:hypothetical protein